MVNVLHRLAVWILRLDHKSVRTDGKRHFSLPFLCGGLGDFARCNLFADFPCLPIPRPLLVPAVSISSASRRLPRRTLRRGPPDPAGRSVPRARPRAFCPGTARQRLPQPPPGSPRSRGRSSCPSPCLLFRSWSVLSAPAGGRLQGYFILNAVQSKEKDSVQFGKNSVEEGMRLRAHQRAFRSPSGLLRRRPINESLWGLSGF
jgi:hypothetical protein